jgi:hypothetical protein
VREDLDIEGDTGEAASLVYPIAARLRSPVVLASLVPRIHALLNDDLPGSGGSLPLRRVSGDFEALWLGGSMVYSCAYFSMGDEDRDAEQEAKLELVKQYPISSNTSLPEILRKPSVTAQYKLRDGR